MIGCCARSGRVVASFDVRHGCGCSCGGIRAWRGCMTCENSDVCSSRGICIGSCSGSGIGGGKGSGSSSGSSI